MAVTKRIDPEEPLPEGVALIELWEQIRTIVDSMRSQIKAVQEGRIQRSDAWFKKLKIAHRIHNDYLKKIESKIKLTHGSDLALAFMDQARIVLDEETYWDILEAAREAVMQNQK